MSESSRSIMVVLQSGIFPDAESLEPAIELLAHRHQMRRYRLTEEAMTAPDWDRLVADILVASKVVTI